MDNPQQSPSILSLCTGGGGLDQGFRSVCGGRVVAAVEIEAFAVANLVQKMEAGKMDPHPIYTNIKTLEPGLFSGGIDVLLGGYPCQPFSHAGKRLGDKDPRHLWPYFLNVIDATMPGLCLFENVEGHITKGLREVLIDLEDRGYKASWGIFSAEECGAPHRRKRVFIMAYRSSPRLERLLGNEHGKTRPQGQCPTRPTTTKSFPAKPGRLQHDWEAPRVLSDANSAQLAQHWFVNGMGREDVAEGNIGDAPSQTQPRMGRTTNGLSHRVDRLRILGNAVVPSCAELATKTLLKELQEK